MKWLFKRGDINIVYGTAGSGKTTLCIQLLPDSVVLDTEGGVSEERLSQLGLSPEIIQIHSWQEQINQVKDLPSKPVIIDRLTHFYKFELCNGREKRKINNELSGQIIALKGHARKHNVPIVITDVAYQYGDRQVMVCNDLLRVNSKSITWLDKGTMKIEKHNYKLGEFKYEIEKDGFQIVS